MVQTSYDIIKAHCGEISVGIPSSEWTPLEEKVETKEGEGRAFIIRLND
ncbi:hypothetical protein BH20BAC1_BH20BAC1_05920 [soil metagenome]